MTIEMQMWRIDNNDQPQALSSSKMAFEERLEEILAKNISLVAPNLLVIGRQVRTDFGKYVDLLAMDAGGNLVVLELKRDRTARDIIAQVLDYGSWVRHLEDDRIAAIYQDYIAKYGNQTAQTIDNAFCEQFGQTTLPDELNSQHQLLIVASELDASTERITEYLLEDYGVAINAVFFSFMADGDAEYLSRAWLRAPDEDSESISTNNKVGKWNGEYYCSFGHHERRDWEDARKYGYVSAGGGSWFTNSLNMLEEGARVWANVPGTGYVGVGIVQGPRQAADEFMVFDDASETEKPLKDLAPSVKLALEAVEDPEKMEYMVPIKWIKTVAVTEAIKEIGFFGNQNTIARPRTLKWAHTVGRLKARFEVT